MAISVSWDNPDKTVICYRMVGRWSWDEFYVIWQDSMVMIRSVTHQVNGIVDLSQSVGMPQGALLKTAYMLRNQPANAGLTIIVNGGDFVNLLIGSLKRVAPREGRHLGIALTVEAARKIITEYAIKEGTVSPI